MSILTQRHSHSRACLIVTEGLDILRLPSRSEHSIVHRPNFNIGSNLVEVPARFTDAPRFEIHRDRTIVVESPQYASWNLNADRTLHTGGRINQVHIVSLDGALRWEKRPKEKPLQVAGRSRTMQINLMHRLRRHGFQCGQGLLRKGDLFCFGYYVGFVNLDVERCDICRPMRSGSNQLCQNQTSGGFDVRN